MNDHDWAEKRIRKLADMFNVSSDDDFIATCAHKLREARKIEWPSIDLIREKQAAAINEAKNMDDLFADGCEWLKQWVEDKRK